MRKHLKTTRESHPWTPPGEPDVSELFFDGMAGAAKSMLVALGHWFFSFDRDEGRFTSAAPTPEAFGSLDRRTVKEMGFLVFEEILTAEAIAKLERFAESSFAFWEARGDWRQWHSALTLDTKEGGSVTLHVFATSMRGGKVATTAGHCRFASMREDTAGHMRHVGRGTVAVFKQPGGPEAHFLNKRQRNLVVAISKGGTWAEKAQRAGFNTHDAARKAAGKIVERLELGHVKELEGLMGL